MTNKILLCMYPSSGTVRYGSYDDSEQTAIDFAHCMMEKYVNVLSYEDLIKRVHIDKNISRDNIVYQNTKQLLYYYSEEVEDYIKKFVEMYR